MKKLIGSLFLFSAVFFISACSLTKNNNAPAANNVKNEVPTVTSTPKVGTNTSIINIPGEVPKNISAPAKGLNSPAKKKVTDISIQNFAFNPQKVNIKKGSVVTWVNDDQAPHQIKFANVVSSVLLTGQTFSYTFSDTGSFDYICAIHPSMTGKIIVE